MAGRGGTFFEELCKHSYGIKVIFAISTLFLVLHVPYPFVVEYGTALYVIATMNIVGSVFFIVVSGLTLRKCSGIRESYGSSD